MKNILFIDGRNLISKMRSIINPNSQQGIDFSVYNFKGLIEKVLEDISVDRMIFYFGRVLEHRDTVEKSKQLIEEQRKLKTHLEKTRI